MIKMINPIVKLTKRLSAFVVMTGVLFIAASPGRAANMWTAPDQEAAKERAKCPGPHGPERSKKLEEAKPRRQSPLPPI